MTDRKVCAITGGTSGIGLATAKLFLRNGYAVSICGSNQQKLEAAQTELYEIGSIDLVHCQALDLNIDGNGNRFVDSTVERFGTLEVLVNNAGVAPLSSIEEFSKAEFNKAINVNIRAVFESTQSAWPIFVKNQFGTIINISSLAADDPFPGFSVYGACKAWCELFARALNSEGKPSGIVCFSVRPGAVSTPMLKGLFPDFPIEQQLEPKQVAKLVFELTSDSSRAGEERVFTIDRQN